MTKYIAAILILISFLLPSSALAETASLTISGAPARVSVGERFTVTVRVRSVDQAINAISGTIVYPSNLIKLLWDPLESTCRHASLSIL